MRIDLSPFKNTSFSRLWMTQVANLTGDWLGVIALAVLVFDQTGSPLATALLFISTRFLPALVAPALVARFESIPTSRSLPLIYISEAVLFGILAIIADNFLLPAVAAVAFIDGSLAISGRSLLRSSTALIMRPLGLLREANSLFNIASTWSIFLAPAAGGVIVATFGARDALLIDAATFLVAGLIISTAKGLPDAVLDAAHWRRRLREGIAYVKKSPTLKTLFIIVCSAFVFTELVLPIEVVLVKGTLNGGDAGYGLFLASWGVGMALGGLWYAFSEKRHLVLLAAASLFVLSISDIGTALSPTLAFAYVAQAVGGAAVGVGWVAMMTLIQEATGDAYQARVMSLLESATAVMPGLGIVFGGIAAAAISARAAYLIAGAGTLIVAIGAAFKFRSVSHEPATHVAEAADPAEPG